MSSLGSQPQVARVFQSALRQVLKVTQAERSVILFGEGAEEPKVRAVSGFPSDNFWLTAPLSLSILRNVCKTGEPLEVTDVTEAPALQSELSLVLANVRSLVCAPIWSSRGNVAGLIYADWVDRAGTARQRLLPRLQEVARQIEAFLRKVEAGENACDPFENVAADREPVARPIPPAPPISRRKRQFRRPDPPSLSIFFRSLAAMFGAGLPLVASLYTLSKTPGAVSEISEELARRLERGQSFSAAAQELGVFSELVLTSLRAGERSGRLHLCLERLAQLQESSARRQAKMRAALIYPTFVLLGCSLFLVVAPAAMLSTQLKLLQQTRTALPWISQLLLSLYSPWSLLLGILLGVVVVHQRRRLGMFWSGQIKRWPVLGSLWRSYEMAQWTELLALQLNSGLTLLQCLPTDSPLHDGLVQGDEFWMCLRAQNYSRVVCEIVRAGEESGQLTAMLQWLSNHFQADFEERLEALSRLLEPLIMAFLGLLAGALMVATLLPMSRAVQNL